MKAIVIQQPWAWAIMAGHKKIENRTWTTGHRGDLLIVAGKSTARLASGTEFLRQLGITVPGNLTYGAAIGIVSLADISPVADCDRDDPFAEGPWCWILRRPRRLSPPVPVRGQMGLFQVRL